MTKRLTWAAVLSVLMIPLLGIGWLDPLEGLPLVVLGIGTVVAVRLLSRVRIPRFTWISFVVTAALMVVTLVGAGVQGAFMMQAQEAGDTVMNPLREGFMIGGVPILAIMLWLARVADLVMVAGLVVYCVRVFRARAEARVHDLAQEPPAGNAQS